MSKLEYCHKDKSIPLFIDNLVYPCVCDFIYFSKNVVQEAFNYLLVVGICFYPSVIMIYIMAHSRYQSLLGKTVFQTNLEIKTIS